MLNRNLLEHFVIETAREKEVREKKEKESTDRLGYDIGTIFASGSACIGTLYYLFDQRKKTKAWLYSFFVLALAVAVLYLNIKEKDNMTIFFGNNSDYSNIGLLSFSILSFCMGFGLAVFTPS